MNTFREILEAKFVKPEIGDSVTFKYKKGTEWGGKIKSKKGNNYIVTDINPKSDWKKMFDDNEIEITNFQIKSINGIYR